MGVVFMVDPFKAKQDSAFVCAVLMGASAFEDGRFVMCLFD
jgi:hypothetical protein